MEGLTSQCASQSVGPANQLFGLLIQTILAAQCTISPPELWPKDYGPTAVEKGLEEYDFIVVGAGSAGSVVASRLSENKNWKVLLLEAGGDPPIESEIPNLSMSMQHTPFDWGYRIENSNKSCRSNHPSIKDGGCYWPRGKMLGGSDSMSNMLYLRGNEMDFNEWEQIVKHSDWGWENVLKYYMKSENNQRIELLNVKNSEKYHSKNGLLKVNSFTRNVYDFQIYKYIMIEAAKQLDYEYVKDFNSGKYLGFSQVQCTTGDGVRDTTMKSFLNSNIIKDRSNLHVIKNALVTKINMDERQSINGIEYQLNGTNYQANSRKEIILSAGVIGTPQILMLSGIGPKPDLEKLNIKIQQNLPVGQNLQDHISISLYFQFNSTRKAPMGKEELLDHLYYFTMQRDGPFATIGISDLVGFINTNNNNNQSKNGTIKNSEYPNVQLNFQYFMREALDLQFYLTISDFQEMIGRRILDANQYYDIVIVNIHLLKPKSIGKIKLRSVNPNDAPLIEANYLNNNNDVDTILNGIKFVQKFSDTKAFEAVGGKLMRLPLIDCKNVEYGSDSYWKCYIKYMSRSSYNPVGTVKMASNEDGKKTAVVDYRLRVLGIKGLRVIDASIMPTIVSASVNPTTIMIAEKGSAMIKDDWQDPSSTKLPTQEL